MPETVEIRYQPRPQFVAFHRRKQRWACIVAHRRAGKSLACIMDLIDAAVRCKQPDGRFAFISPTYTQAKDTVFAYLKRYTASIPGVEQRESDLSVIFPNGARVRLYGAESYDRLRGIYLDAVVMDEVADMPPQAWTEVIRPALSDRKGWAVFIGTPRGRNQFWELHEHAQADPSWFSLVLRADETGILDPDELADMRLQMTDDQYAQELQCSFDAAIVGAYFAHEIAAAEAEGRITTVPHDAALPTHTAWDLGIGDSTAIWFFQVQRKELRIIDYYEASGQALPHYTQHLASKPYSYGRDYLPHDAMAREMGTGRSIFEQLKALTHRHPFLVPKLSVMDGIAAARMTIAAPTTYIDATATKAGLEALRAYRADFDERRKVFADRPRHDWASHGSDAFRYLSLAWRQILPAKPPPPPKDSWAKAFERDRAHGEPDGWRIA